MSFFEYPVLSITFASMFASEFSEDTAFFTADKNLVSISTDVPARHFRRQNEQSVSAEECTLSVLPGDTENLRLTLANAPANCRIMLSGTYLLDGLLHVNRPLTASASHSAQLVGEDRNWFMPDQLMESNSAIQVMCLEDNEKEHNPVLKITSQPAAAIKIRQGGVFFSESGGLHEIGIIDAREWPENETPALISLASEHQNNLSFTRVSFSGSYPCVSDIYDSHPYWSNNEPVEHGGNAARAGRIVLWSLGAARGSRANTGSTSRRLYSASAGGGRPPKKPNHNRSRKHDDNDRLVKEKKASEERLNWLSYLVTGVAIGASAYLAMLVARHSVRAEYVATDYLEKRIRHILSIFLKRFKKR